MKSKMLVCGALAAVLTMSLALGSGCATRNEEDMNQVVATVNITNSANLEEEGLAQYASAIGSGETIVKRDLMASYYNVGYSYIESGSTYAEVFEMLMDALTTTAIITQYTTLQLISDRSQTNSNFLNEYNAIDNPVEKYEYLLEGYSATTDDGERDRIMLAQYSLYSSINDSLDSIEEGIISGEDEETTSDETRATPGGADEEVENYLPVDSGTGALDYNIYTGYSSVSDGYDYSLENSGIYEDDKLEGTTPQTRRRAYASFIASLRDNFLITEEDNLRDVLSISYIQEEYLSQLQQQVINEYYEQYEQEQEDLIDAKDAQGNYTFLQTRYASDLADQTQSNATFSAFESSMDSLSDTSFILYAPATSGTDGGTYGYVYNILLPFSASQELNINSSDTSKEYYYGRISILDDIKATDQRSAWFNGETDYSFNAAEAGMDYYAGAEGSGREYLFFENNLTDNERYATLDKYDGRYSYNGYVSENADGSYSLVPERLTVDDVLAEFKAYVDYVLGGEYTTIDTAKTNDELAGSYYVSSADEYEDENGEIDYSHFVYAKGRVDLGGDTSLSSLFVKDSRAYKALSAVNELQYAYTTDTSILSQYIGYSVSAFSTSYIPEFEYAAQTAINEGAGTIYVCAGDYGWHIIYVTATFDVEGGDVYGDLEWTDDYVKSEGTFQNMYYNWIKDSTLTNITTNRRSVINELYGGDETVTTYQNAYQDLLDLDEE